jgi:ankyrin repeat protein
MERGVGRSYYFLFSDMLITCKRKEKGNKLGKLGGKGMSKLGGSARSSVSVQYEGYEIETVYDTTDLKSARIISHAYHADETERRGVQIMLPDMPMLYAVSVDDALQWARAFKRVVFGLLGEDPRAAYVTHHTLCEGTLFSAAMTGNLATVKQAIALDPESAAAVDEYGATALMMAANKGHITVVLPILSTGQADVNASDAEGNTAGHLAAHGCHTDVLDILGTYEFNFNKPNKQDEVPLGILIKQGAMDAAQTSVSKGAVADRVDRSGRSGLHNAVMAGSVDEVKRWLQVGANPDKPVADRSRQTPLLLASMLTAAAGCAATTQALLDGGANPNKPGDRTGTVVLQALLDGGKLLAAEACVRAGGRYKALSGVAGDTKAHFEQLSQEYVAEKKRADEVAASLAEVGACHPGPRPAQRIFDRWEALTV